MNNGMLLPTCANTFGERGHQWQFILGGKRCEVCGAQEAFPMPTLPIVAEHYANAIPFAVLLGAYMRMKACLRSQINFTISTWASS